MASTPVQRDQFKISSRSITHKPTGATYTPHPAPPTPESLLPNGEAYRPHEVQVMMEQLWAEYVNANPRLFDVHD
jgi:hypothetical protein